MIITEEIKPNKYGSKIIVVYNLITHAAICCSSLESLLKDGRHIMMYEKYFYEHFSKSIIFKYEKMGLT